MTESPSPRRLSESFLSAVADVADLAAADARAALAAAVCLQRRRRARPGRVRPLEDEEFGPLVEEGGVRHHLGPAVALDKFEKLEQRQQKSKKQSVLICLGKRV